MDYYTTRRTTCCVLHAEGGRVTDAERREFFRTLNTLARKEKDLAVNLNELTYANSQFLGQLLIAHNLLKKRSGKFSIVCSEGPVFDLLRITGMNTVFRIVSNEKML